MTSSADAAVAWQGLMMVSPHTSMFKGHRKCIRWGRLCATATMPALIEVATCGPWDVWSK
jgi:hypothetical protein